MKKIRITDCNEFNAKTQQRAQRLHRNTVKLYQPLLRDLSALGVPLQNTKGAPDAESTPQTKNLPIKNILHCSYKISTILPWKKIYDLFIIRLNCTMF